MISKESLLSGETAENIALVFGRATIGGIGIRAYMKSMLRDRGFRVFATPSEEALNSVLKVTAQNGLKPRRRITEEGGHVLRALLEDNITVINATTDPDAREEIGNPSAAIMLRAKRPLEAAELAAATLEEDGFSATIIDESAITEGTKGEMVFLATDALEEGITLGFREHVTKMGPMPPRWHKGE